MFAVPPKDQFCDYVTVPAFWQNLVAHRMLRVPLLPMFTNYAFAFGDKALRFGRLLLKTTMAELTIVSFVCFIQATKYDVNDLFMPARLCALTDDGHLRANDGVSVSLSSEVMADALKCGHFHLMSDCAVDRLSAILASALAGEID